MKSQSFCLNVGKYGCLALCYLYAFLDFKLGISEWKDENKVNEELLHALLYVYQHSNALDEDMYVKDAEALFECLGANVKVSKEVYDKDSTLEGYNCLQFENGVNSHWVLYKDNKLLYNSLNYSNCVENGFISGVRRIKWV